MTRGAPVHTPNLAGADVFEVAFNGQSSLLRMSREGESFCLGIEGKYAVRRGESAEEGSGEDALSLPILARQVGSKVKDLVVDADGSAALRFIDGVEVISAPGDEYESWNFSGPDGLFFVGGTKGQFHSWG